MLRCTLAFAFLNSDDETRRKELSGAGQHGLQFTLKTPNYEKKQQETLVSVAGFQWE